MTTDLPTKSLNPTEFATASLGADLQRQIRDEAASRQEIAELIAIDSFSLDEDGALRGKRHVSASGPGPVLTGLHHGVGLALARSASSHPTALFPTRASYLYYAPGDFVLLHHDVTQCTVTILAALSASADPLVTYPSFGTATASDIPHLNAAPFDSHSAFDAFMNTRLPAERLVSMPIQINSDSLLLLPGRDLLHARYPQDNEVAMVALCYSALIHQPHWSSSRRRVPAS